MALWNRMHRLLTSLVIFSLILSGLFVAPTAARAAAGPDTATIVLNDNQSSTYEIEFLGVSGNTWTYRVTELQGRDLSHWSLGISSCLDKIVSSSPPGAEIGPDGSTGGFLGIKWNTNDGFASGEFSFTLDGDYPVGTVDVLAKAGNAFGTAPIAGPVCDEEPPSEPTEVIVTPASPKGWAPANVRNGGSAELTCANPRNGNGSIEFNSPSGSAKADFANYWGVIAGRTLGNLSAFSYEWYRDGSSTNPAVQAPALRLFYLDQNGTPGDATDDESGYLIYEPVYNGYPAAVPTDAWVASNAFAGNFWMRAFSPGRTIDDYNVSLAEWLANADEEGSPIDDDADSDTPHTLGADTYIIGIEVGVGSGWNGVFRGYADSIRIGFGAGDDTIWNFEGDCAPPTGSLKITKSVSWGSFPPDAEATFEICISGDGLAQPICETFSPGESVTFDGLAPGDYTIAETDPGAVWTVTGEGAVSVAASATAEATVTNTHAAFAALGLTSLCTIAPASDGQALWRVRNTNPYPVEYTWQIGSGGATTTRTVAANSDDIFQGPAGTMIIKVNGVQQSVKATNPALCTGEIKVTKTVSWGSFPPDPDASFEICVSGNGLAQPICKTTSGGELTFSGLLPGEYTVDETDPGAVWTVTGEGQVTVALRETSAASITNTHAAFSKLNLVSVCSDDPTATRRWRVDNPNPYPVEFTYVVYGTSQTGTLVVPANSSGANPFFFETDTVGGSNTTIIFVNGVQQSVKASGGQQCTPPTGSLKITKVVELDGLTPPQPGDLFEICISGPSYPSGDCKTVGVAGGDLVWTNLQPGVYSFSESAPGTEWSASHSPASQEVTVVAGQQATATVTNKLCCLYATQIDLQANSTGVAGQVAVVYSDGYVPENVEVKVRWTQPDGSTVEQTAKTNASGVASFSLPSGQSGQFKLEVIGISDAPNGATAFCPERGVTTKTINRPGTGRLVVTKRVNWDGFVPSAASFEICIKGPSYPNGNEPGACKTVSVTGNEGTNVVNLTATWTNLAPGAYTATESDPGASWIVTGNGATVQVAAGGTGRTTIVNKFCSLISKRIAMSVNARGDVIARVYLQFTDGYNAFVTDVEAEWTLPNGTKLPVRVQTNGSGMATFRLSNPPAGSYTITVLKVDWPGEQLNLNKGQRVKSITKS